MRGEIIYVIEDLPMGGMERAVQGWAIQTRAAGLEVRVVCARGGGPVADELRAAGVRVDVAAKSSFISLSNVLRGPPPFVIHSHGAARTIARLAGRLAGAAGIVHHLHTKERFGPKQRLFERALPPDAYLACSNFVREDFLRQVAGREVEVLYNSVDTERLRFSADLRRRCRAELGIDDKSPVILTAGRFVAIKGQSILIQAASRILAARPDATFLFLGDGPERAGVERQAAGLGARARFLGVRADIAPYLSAADVYVQPSLEREGMPMAVLEALACARPIVASSLPGLCETVGDAGIAAPPGDEAALAGAIVGLLNDDDRRAELGRLARERAQRFFSTETTFPKLLAVYRRLLGEAP